MSDMIVTRNEKSAKDEISMWSSSLFVGAGVALMAAVLLGLGDSVVSARFWYKVSFLNLLKDRWIA